MHVRSCFTNAMGVLLVCSEVILWFRLGLSVGRSLGCAVQDGKESWKEAGANLCCRESARVLLLGGVHRSSISSHVADLGICFARFRF